MRFVIGLIFYLWNMCLLAQGTLIVPSQEKEIPIRLYAQYIEDPNNTLTFEQVSALSFESKWQSSPNKDIGLGQTTSACWVRLKIKATDNISKDWLLVNKYCWMNYLTVYITHPQKPTKRMELGTHQLPLEKRHIPHGYLNFPIAHHDTTTYTYYMHAHGYASVLFPMYAMPAESYQSQARFQERIYGILVGMVLFIAIYSLSIYFYIKDLAYLLYVFYLLSAFLLFSNLTGLLHIYFPILDNKHVYHPFGHFILMLPSIIGIFFTLRFLNIRETARPYYKPLLYTAFVFMVMALVGLFVHSAAQYYFYGLTYIIILLAFVLLGLRAWRRGRKEARFFTLGYFSYFLLSMPSNGFYAGLAPISFWTVHGVEIGMVLEMIFLVFSLAAKTRYEREKAEKEKAEAQAEALRVQKEANETLERKVQDRTLQLKEANEELNQTNEELHTTLELVEEEKKKADKLLLNILPEKVAIELKNHGFATPRSYEKVTILFTDFKGFTQIVSKMNPEQVLDNLNYCFTAFDKIIRKYGLEKIKTIGDSYMCAGGLPEPDEDNPERVVYAALELVEFIQKWKDKKIKHGKEAWDIRVGIHTGSVVAGVVGDYKFAFDIWGDAVNTASRMESSGEASKINISGDTYHFIKHLFDCTYRGQVDAKNKGSIDMYFVNHALPQKS